MRCISLTLFSYDTLFYSPFYLYFEAFNRSDSHFLLSFRENINISLSHSKKPSFLPTCISVSLIRAIKSLRGQLRFVCAIRLLVVIVCSQDILCRDI